MNRAPFDLLEGERELIRGFNVEIRRVNFVFIFLREYGSILVLACVFRFIVVRKLGMVVILVSLILLLVRRCYPRTRYDVMISLV